MTKIDITRTELVWPGKYNEDGTLKEAPWVSLPSQVIETVNESRTTREVKKGGVQGGLFDVYEGKEGHTFEASWRHRDLSDKHCVYVWADGIYFQVRLEPDRSCVLVIIGATKDGCKELLAIEDGHRENKLSWHSVLTDLKRRGLKEAPALAIGDGGLGFWAALEEVFPGTNHQRCWVHKTTIVLDNLPKVSPCVRG